MSFPANTLRLTSAHSSSSPPTNLSNRQREILNLRYEETIRSLDYARESLPPELLARGTVDRTEIETLVQSPPSEARENGSGVEESDDDEVWEYGDEADWHYRDGSLWRDDNEEGWQGNMQRALRNTILREGDLEEDPRGEEEGYFLGLGEELEDSSPANTDGNSTAIAWPSALTPLPSPLPLDAFSLSPQYPLSLPTPHPSSSLSLYIEDEGYVSDWGDMSEDDNDYLWSSASPFSSSTASSLSSLSPVPSLTNSSSSDSSSSSSFSSGSSSSGSSSSGSSSSGSSSSDSPYLGSSSSGSSSSDSPYLGSSSPGSPSSGSSSSGSSSSDSPYLGSSSSGSSPSGSPYLGSSSSGSSSSDASCPCPPSPSPSSWGASGEPSEGKQERNNTLFASRLGDMIEVVILLFLIVGLSVQLLSR
jgi:hypothetical protein